MNENNNQNIEEQNNVVEQKVEEPVQNVEVAPVAQEVNEVAAQNSNSPKKGMGKLIAILGVVAILVGAILFVVFGTDLLKGKKEDKKEEQKQEEKNELSKFYGIYESENSKLFIKSYSETEIWYTLAGDGLFQGEAKVEKNVATEVSHFDSKNHFELELKDDGNVEVKYVTEDPDSSAAIDTGTYKRVADYNKENLYKYAVGDPQYLKSNYSGIYKSGEVEMVLYQISETEVKASLYYKNKKDYDLPSFDETLVIESENTLVAKDFFDENANAYTLTFNGKEFSLTCNSEVFGFNEEDKKLELTYEYEKEITEEEILKEYYEFF